jgi:hypothetical protein
LGLVPKESPCTFIQYILCTQVRHQFWCEEVTFNYYRHLDTSVIFMYHLKTIYDPVLYS